MSLKLVTINVNGLRDNRKRELVFNWLVFGAYISKIWNTAFSVFISHVNSLPVLSEKLKLISKAKCLLKRMATPFDSLDPHNHALAPPPCVFHSLSHRLISTPVQCVSCKQIQSYFFDTIQLNFSQLMKRLKCVYCQVKINPSQVSKYPDNSLDNVIETCHN
jgi:hypothetical protein